MSIPRRRFSALSPDRRSIAPLKATICYSVKELREHSHLRLLREQGCGFNVTSGGELFRVLKAGGDPKKIIYAGVGKTDQEIADGINAEIAAFNLESEAEIENIDRIAGSIGKTAIGAIRINPDVDAKSHAKTTTGRKGDKFGVDIERAERVFEQYRNLKNLRIARRSYPHRIAGIRDPAVCGFGRQDNRADRPVDRTRTQH